MQYRSIEARPNYRLADAMAEAPEDNERLDTFQGRRFRALRAIQRCDMPVFAPPGIDHTLAFQLAGGEVSRYYENGLDQTVHGTRRSSLIPAGRMSGWYIPEPIDIIHLSIDDRDLRHFAEEEFDLDPHGIEMRDYLAVEDPVMSNLAPLIVRELQSNLPHSDLMLGALESVIAAHMLRRFSNVADLVERVGRREARHRDRSAVEKTKAMVMDRLNENLTNTDLATEVGVSPFRLMRLFKAETGMTIRGFVMQARIAYVRDRLMRTHDPLVQIALDAGFSSQAHMTAAYTAAMGISPGRHRRDAGQAVEPADPK